jgi:hypothetical protein
VSFEEYVSFDNNVVMCEVKTLEQVMDEKFTSDVSEEEEDDLPITVLSVRDDINSASKYLMQSDVNSNMMAAPCIIDNEVYRILQKVKKQQLT